MTRWWNRKRFDVVECTLALLLTTVIVFAATRPEPPVEHETLDLLHEKYGPARSSEKFEEWIIRDFFNDRRNGFFLDVGANHHKRASNTYFLETALGWQGIAVEPLVQFEAGYLQERPRTKFRPFFAASRSNEQAKMYLQENRSLVTSSDRSFTERWGKNVKEIQVPTITLDDLLASEGVAKVDFLSMDIELAEPEALAGFDLRRYAPDLVCIEAHPEVRQAILQYFTRHGYVVVGKYLRIDTTNLYFTPGSG